MNRSGPRPLCPECGDELPEKLIVPDSGPRFRVCSRSVCSAHVPESRDEWRARTGADLLRAEARIRQLLDRLDSIDIALGLQLAHPIPPKE